jgi:antitoxin (DNA-binding transcriptional repressor) of toxin-antitoxin stability system
MTRTISQRELRNESGKVMRALERGERFVITRDGIPVGELGPIRPRRFVPREEVLAIFHGAPRIDYRQLRADLDAVAAQDPHPRKHR